MLSFDSMELPTQRLSIASDFFAVLHSDTPSVQKAAQVFDLVGDAMIPLTFSVGGVE